MRDFIIGFIVGILISFVLIKIVLKKNFELENANVELLGKIAFTENALNNAKTKIDESVLPDAE